MKATVTTYKTAKRHNVNAVISEVSEMFREMGSQLSKPNLNDTRIRWMIDGEMADSLDIVRVTCDCGDEFAELISTDDMSSLSWIKCPCCGQYTQEYEYNDKINRKRNWKY